MFVVKQSMVPVPCTSTIEAVEADIQPGLVILGYSQI